MQDGTRLTEELRALALSLGADIFGVADLSLAKDFAVAQGGEALRRWPRAISFGIFLCDSIVDSYDPYSPQSQSEYGHLSYQVVNPVLDTIGLRLSRWLEKQGLATLPVPASLTINRPELKGLISHKLVANLAGLGWIGKNCLLVTPDHGPRVRLATLLTDVPLVVGQPLKRGCGRCKSCIEVCPVKAFTGREFRPEEERELRFDAHACVVYRNGDPPEGHGSVHVCGLCVSSCPWGQQHLKKVRRQRKEMVGVVA